VGEEGVVELHDSNAVLGQNVTAKLVIASLLEPSRYPTHRDSAIEEWHSLGVLALSVLNHEIELRVIRVNGQPAPGIAH